MSKHHKNNNNNKYNNNNELEKMAQKNQVNHNPENSGKAPMQKGAMPSQGKPVHNQQQGGQNKPMQQGKPVQGQPQSGQHNKPMQGQQKPQHSQGNNPESFKKNK